MICGYFSATGAGHLAAVESTMNSSDYQSILETNVKPSVWQLKFHRNHFYTNKNTGFKKKEGGWLKFSLDFRENMAMDNSSLDRVLACRVDIYLSE